MHINKYSVNPQYKRASQFKCAVCVCALLNIILMSFAMTKRMDALLAVSSLLRQKLCVSFGRKKKDVTATMMSMKLLVILSGSQGNFD